jgi:hypothetical protein
MIVYRESTHQIGFCDYHRRAADPSLTVTTAFFDSLRSGTAFTTVAPYDGQERRDYLITGRVDKLHEIDCGTGVMVEAKLSAVLTNLQWEPWCDLGNFECRKEPVNSEVAEMSRAVHGKQQSARE